MATLKAAKRLQELLIHVHHSLSRPYIRLDRQPEATRRAYAKEYGIPLRELGLELEAGGHAAGAENARSGRSDEIEAGLARYSNG